MDTLYKFLDLLDGEENSRRKKFWNSHNNLEVAEKIPVYMGVPFDWSIIRINLWMELLDTQLDVSAIMSTTGEYPAKLAKEVVDFQLKQRIFYIEHMPGDKPVEPKISTNFNLLWLKDVDNINPIWRKVDYDLKNGNFHVNPIIDNIDDIDKFKFQEYHLDKDLHRKRTDLFRELTDGKLEIQDDIMGFGYLNSIGPPFAEACRMRGMLELLMDMQLSPELVHRLMKFLTENSISRCRKMTEITGVEFQPPIGEDDVNCQMFSAEHYDEFIYPYEKECAAHGKNYYYHSCGDLTPIFDRILKLPNIHKIHVSAWSNLKTAVDIIGNKKVIQKLANTQKDILRRSETDIEQDLISIRSDIGNSITEVACHCETFDDFEKSVNYIKMAEKILRR